MAKAETEKIKAKEAVTNSKSNDTDMPQPMTNDYKPTVKFTPMFLNLFNTCIGNLPYSTILTNSNNEKIKLIDVVKFVEAKQEKITVDELNTVLGFVASAPFKVVRPLMEIIENADQQKNLWTEIK